MELIIKTLEEHTIRLENELFRVLMELDNHMNDCECEERKPHYFHNILPHNEHCIFCLGCGGMLNYED